MRNMFVIFISLLFGSAQAQKNGNDDLTFPSYDSVVTHFFTTQNFVSFQHQYEFEFQKKPKGWFIVTNSKTNPLNTDTTALWLIDERDFVLPRGEVGFGAYHSKRYIQKTIAQFLEFPFWGYKNYVADNINYYKAKSKLLPRDYYNLARLYTEEVKELVNGTNTKQLNENIIAKLEANYINCLAALRQLKSIQPNFYLPDLGIEELTAYCKLDFAVLYSRVGEHDLANKIFESTQLPKFVDEYWRLYASELNKNAIVFSGSKAEAYPLLWLQKKGIRKDVTIVRLDLLKNRWYREELIKQKPSLFAFKNFEELPNVTFTYNPKIMMANVFRQILKTAPDSAMYWEDVGVKSFKIDARSIVIKSQGSRPTINFSWATPPSKAQLFYFLVINANFHSRQLVFTNKYMQREFGLQVNNLRRNNMVRELSTTIPDAVKMQQFQKELLNLEFDDFNYGPNNFVINELTSYFVDYLKNTGSSSAEKEHHILAKKMCKYLSGSLPKAHFNLFYFVHLCNKMNLKTNVLSDHLVKDLKAQALQNPQYKAGINLLANRIITLLNPERDGYFLGLMTKQFPVL